MKKIVPYWQRMIIIIVLAMLAWALILLAIWLVGNFSAAVWTRRWFIGTWGKSPGAQAVAERSLTRSGR